MNSGMSDEKIELDRSTRRTIWRNFTSSPNYEEKLIFLQKNKLVKFKVKLLESGDLLLNGRFNERQIQNINKLFYIENVV